MTLGPACWCLLLRPESKGRGREGKWWMTWRSRVQSRAGGTGGPSGRASRTWRSSGTWRRSTSSQGWLRHMHSLSTLRTPRDGRWSAEQSQAVPFRTRIVVRRPVDPSRFNGTVVVEWNNVSMAHDLMLTDIRGLAAAGFAFVGVSAQPLGIRGFANRRDLPDRMGRGPLRYPQRPERERVVRRVRPGRRGGRAAAPAVVGGPDGRARPSSG